MVAAVVGVHFRTDVAVVPRAIAVPVAEPSPIDGIGLDAGAHVDDVVHQRDLQVG